MKLKEEKVLKIKNDYEQSLEKLIKDIDDFNKKNEFEKWVINLLLLIILNQNLINNKIYIYYIFINIYNQFSHL